MFEFLLGVFVGRATKDARPQDLVLGIVICVVAFAAAGMLAYFAWVVAPDLATYAEPAARLLPFLDFSHERLSDPFTGWPERFFLCSVAMLAIAGAVFAVSRTLVALVAVVLRLRHRGTA